MTIQLFKNDEEVIGYEVGTPIIETGKYILKAVDKFENETVIDFEIDVSGVIVSTSEELKITEKEMFGEETKPVIRLLIPKTKVGRLKEMLSSEMPFEILNAQGEEIESEDSYEVEEVKPEEPIIDNETEEVETSDEEEDEEDI